MKKLLEWPRNKSIVAIDFDGTITIRDNRVWDGEYYENDVFHENIVVTNWIRTNRNKFYFILWTCRCGKALQDAVDYCRNIGIEFDAINDNIVAYKSSNKVLADYYLDDKAIGLGQLDKVI